MNKSCDFITFDLEKDMGLVNLTDEFFCFYLYNLFIQKKKNILIVCSSLYEANKYYSNLINYSDNVLLFPMDDFLTSEALAISPDLMMNRLETIRSIFNDNYIVITNLMGYLRFLPSKTSVLCL